MAGVDWDNISSAYAPSVSLVNGRDKLIEHMSKTTALVDSVFKDKRSIDEKNTANLKDRNTTDIEMRLASGEIKPEDLAGMSGVYMDGNRITKFVDSMRTQEHNDNILNEQIRMRKEAEKVAAANTIWQNSQTLVAQDAAKLAKANSFTITKGTLGLQKSKERREDIKFKKDLAKQGELEAAKDTADYVATLPYTEQDIIMNDPAFDPTLKANVREIMKTFPGRYSDANNLSDYSEEDQGAAKLIKKTGENPADFIANKADKSALHAFEILKTKQPKKARALAKKIDPYAYAPVTMENIIGRGNALMKRIQYNPSIATGIGRTLTNIGIDLFGAATLTGRNTTYAKEQLNYMEEIRDSLSDGEDKKEADLLVAELKDLLHRKKTGANMVSDELLKIRLQNALPGAGKRITK